MKPFTLVLCLLASMFSACDKDHCNQASQSDGYLIFGHYYGECLGKNCIEIYKLDQNQLFEDTLDHYPSSNSFYIAAYIKLPQEKFNTAKDLMNYFPYDLLKEQNNVIGQPDAADGGGLYIEYNKNGVRKFWLIDQMKTNVPAKYHFFMDKVNEKIHLIE